MTTINAIRFNKYAGALICDECRGWNEEDLKIYTADKIKSVTTREVIDHYGTVAFYGNTGTSAIGDELKFNIKRKVNKFFEENKDQPLTISMIADMAFKTILEMKHAHVDQNLYGMYGLKTEDFLRGYILKDGKEIALNNDEILKDVFEKITFKEKGTKNRAVFLNGGIIAGFDEKEGFKLYTYCIYTGMWEPVSAIFIADGSGCDLVNLSMASYASVRTVPERRGDIDKIEGIIALISAVNGASKYNLGVAGYNNIILIDGNKPRKNRYIEINDHRSKLASEIVDAINNDFLTYAKGAELVDKLLFKQASFYDINEQFVKSLKPRKEALKSLRGYRYAKYRIKI